MQPDYRPNHYGPQAYNSTHLPVIKREQAPHNKAPLLGQLLNFGHTQEIIPYWILESQNPEKLREEEQTANEEKKGPLLNIDFRWNHRSIRYDTASGLTTVIIMMSGLGKIFTLFCIPLFLLGSLVTWYILPPNFITFRDVIETIAVGSGFPAFFWLLGSIIIKLPRKWWLRSSKGPQWDLCRETGMVTLFLYKGKDYEKTGKPYIFQAPFYEFEPIVASIPNRHGGTYNNLLLRHRQAPYPWFSFKCLTGDERFQQSVQLWHYIQNYMDISKPLPDTPFLEEYRPYDPTTKAHDVRTGRNPRYWRDMSEADYKKALKATQEYPDINFKEHLCIVEEQVVYGEAGALDSTGKRMYGPHD